ncbi:substrate-binding domain-containing protein, partial [Leptospira borgpetersenii serovar Hardjo-bovis]|nr:substrate-binding domain-containing protein [Leptospira borgpetersenii serovar Hardjo-bovis]
LIASTEAVAVGARTALTDAGIPVPQQVSLIGFDNSPTAPFLSPALASVKDPVTDMVHETINRLIEMLDGGYLSRDNLFVSELILRDSVGNGPEFAQN